ncbi:MAG: hypothetical protein P8I55_12750 [Crocinitomix sp.]|nr:hypothetical protein [Crocinitomix sp.]
MSLEIKTTLKTPKVLVNFEEGTILLAGIYIPAQDYHSYNFRKFDTD